MVALSTARNCRNTEPRHEGDDHGEGQELGVVRRGEFANPIGQFRVADLAAVSRWWKTGQAYDFESYPTLAEAQARVTELRDARATALDPARTHSWVSIRVSGYATAKL